MATLSPLRVSYYAHHVGTGHLRNAQRLTILPDVELQVASTGEQNKALLRGPIEYVPLAADDAPGQHPGKMSRDDILHYAPIGSKIQQRFSSLNRAWTEFSPDLIMVDVSVEVAIFARLSGYPVALRRMPGNRQDQAHQLAYKVSDSLFAYYPAALEDREHSSQFGSKSHYLGVPEPLRRTVHGSEHMGRRIVVQTSLASAIPLIWLVEAAKSSPLWSWEVVGSVSEDPGMLLPANLSLHGIVGHPSNIMEGATLLITSTGHNAVATAAALRRPVLLIPEERPHEEQKSFARTLEAAGVPMHPSWTEPTDWPRLLEWAAASDASSLAKALFVPRDEFAARLRTMVTTTIKEAQATTES